MRHFVLHNNTKRGMSLVEMVIVASVIGTTMLFMFGAIQNIIKLSARSIERVEAASLLEEGAEVVRFLRDTAWTNISNLSNGTTYYPTWSGTTWSLSTTANKVDNRYTRTVVFSPVYRDANNKIATSGTLDAGVKKVTVTVTWQTPSGQFTNTLPFYISQIF